MSISAYTSIPKFSSVQNTSYVHDTNFLSKLQIIKDFYVPDISLTPVNVN